MIVGNIFRLPFTKHGQTLGLHRQVQATRGLDTCLEMLNVTFLLLSKYVPCFQSYMDSSKVASIVRLLK